MGDSDRFQFVLGEFDAQLKDFEQQCVFACAAYELSLEEEWVASSAALEKEKDIVMDVLEA